MKKTTIICLFIVLVAGILVSCTPVQVTKGSATVSGSTTRNTCGWVQLWEGGPKWAEFNVGSTISSYSSTTEYSTANVGGYYEWGGTTDKDTGNAENVNYSGYPSDISGTGVPGSSTLGDTAKLLWGENWKMPSKENLNNLMNMDENGTALTTDLTTWEYCDGSTKQYVPGCTLAGYKVSGVGNYSNSCIFLPFAGYFTTEELDSLGSGGFFWSSTPDNLCAKYLFSDDSSMIMTEGDRCIGRSVRAILAE